MRSHKNTTRLTAKERAWYVVNGMPVGYVAAVRFVERALRAHARETLARKARRK